MYNVRLFLCPNVFIVNILDTILENNEFHRSTKLNYLNFYFLLSVCRIAHELWSLQGTVLVHFKNEKDASLLCLEAVNKRIWCPSSLILMWEYCITPLQFQIDLLNISFSCSCKNTSNFSICLWTWENTFLFTIFMIRVFCMIYSSNAQSIRLATP